LLVYQKQGPDCYDFAFTLGHMVRSRKAKQASQVDISHRFSICIVASSDGLNAPTLGQSTYDMHGMPVLWL